MTPLSSCTLLCYEELVGGVCIVTFTAVSIRRSTMFPPPCCTRSFSLWLLVPLVVLLIVLANDSAAVSQPNCLLLVPGRT